MELYHVLLRIQKNSLEKFTLAVAENQQLPDVEKTDPKDSFSSKKENLLR